MEHPTKPTTQYEYINNVINEDKGKELSYHQLRKHPKYMKIRKYCFANKLRRLAQGVGSCVDGTDIMFFITKNQATKGRLKKVNYGCIIVDYLPQKMDPHQTRLTVCGNLISYTGDVSTPTVKITKGTCDVILKITP